MAAKILVVDDDHAIRDWLRAKLSKKGFEVAVAADGYSVAQAFLQHKPDLLILDYQMPAGTGSVVLQRVRLMTAGERVPVIFLTAEDLTLVRAQVLDETLVRFIEKPVDFDLLLSEIALLLDFDAA